ncbi:MAG: hypothetical protein ABEJ88_05965 [Halobacterium sp.]
MDSEADERRDVSAVVDDVHERAAALGGGEAALAAVFTDGFMRRHTDAASFREFLAESRWDVESTGDFADVPESAFDEYVADRTAFADWEAMVGRAGEEWIARQLGL